MKKTVILSTNDNPDYLGYLPFVQEAWNKLGWNTLTFYLGESELPTSDQNLIIRIKTNSKYKDATMVQVARLFGHLFTDGLIMTSDVDMMPMRSYWNPMYRDITCYGRDLTGGSQQPICYIAMNAANWKSVIPETQIDELLDKYPNALSDDFYKWWGVDQEIMTERLSKLPHVVNIPRGFTNGLATGRIDRADWENTILSPGLKIDAHMVRPYSAIEAERILNMVFI